MHIIHMLTLTKNGIVSFCSNLMFPNNFIFPNKNVTKFTLNEIQLSSTHNLLTLLLGLFRKKVSLICLQELKKDAHKIFCTVSNSLSFLLPPNYLS